MQDELRMESSDKNVVLPDAIPAQAAKRGMMEWGINNTISDNVLVQK